jgi:hypothetical protein
MSDILRDAQQIAGARLQSAASEEHRVADFVHRNRDYSQYYRAESVGVYTNNSTKDTVYLVTGTLAGHCATCKAVHPVMHTVTVVIKAGDELRLVLDDHTVYIAERTAIPHPMSGEEVLFARLEVVANEDDDEEVTL